MTKRDLSASRINAVVHLIVRPAAANRWLMSGIRHRDTAPLGHSTPAGITILLARKSGRVRLFYLEVLAGSGYTVTSECSLTIPQEE